MKISSEIKNYNTIVKRIRLMIEKSENVSDIKRLKKKLFLHYEWSVNGNNEIKPSYVKELIKDFLLTEAKLLNKNDLNNWLSSISLPRYPVSVFFCVDKIITPDFNAFLSPIYKQEKVDYLKDKIIDNLIKHSERYSKVPDTDENFRLLLKGVTIDIKMEREFHDFSDSPIEEILYNSLVPIVEKYNSVIEREYKVYLDTQVLLYKLDIAIFLPTGDKIDIETDGLTYHSSHTSMANDRKRDRWLVTHDWKVLRYTSRDVLKKLNMCIFEIEAFLKHLLDIT